MNKTINLLIETSPLGNANAHRGIGTYTRLLTENLENIPQLNIQRSTLEVPQDFKADLVHYPYFDLFFSTLPINHPAKSVVTIHDVIPLKFPDQYDPGLKGSMRFVKQKFALSKVDAVITDSQASKSDIIEHLGVNEEKIHVVYLAASAELQAADQTSINRTRRNYKLPKNYILYVGDINYNKNIPQLIKALKYLATEVKLVLVGRNFKPQDIPEWQWIETQLALSDVESRVKFIPDLGSDSVADLAAIYSDAIAYIQPSLYEGFGLPVLEAMQCRTPVVCTDNSSLKEVGGQEVIFTDTDGEAIAGGVEEILNWSKTKRLEKIRSAYKWSQTFSWEKTAQETYKVYQSILNK
jgi:glycosyltransferase involved in cell wall biosynthesis